MLAAVAILCVKPLREKLGFYLLLLLIFLTAQQNFPFCNAVFTVAQKIHCLKGQLASFYPNTHFISKQFPDTEKAAQWSREDRKCHLTRVTHR